MLIFSENNAPKLVFGKEKKKVNIVLIIIQIEEFISFFIHSHF